jgi:diguanylate cyclase (GGDEF)-like protein
VFKSFQTRLMLFFVALFALVQAITFIAVQNGIVTNIFDQAKDQLMATGGILDRRISTTAESLAQGTSLLASDFGFRQAVATSDQATILSALNNLATRMSADRILLLSLEGRVSADTGTAADGGARGDIVTVGTATAVFPFPAMLEEAEADGRSVAIAVLDDRVYQIVVVPILAPVPIAWIAIGLEIGDMFAAEMKRQSTVPVEVTFGHVNKAGRWGLSGSTIPADMRAVLLTALQSRPLLTTPAPVSMAGAEYVTMVAPFPGAQQSDTVYAVLQYSLDVALQPYRSLFFQLLVVTGAAVVMSIIGAGLVARSIAKPIRRLDAAAQRIQIGRYAEKVPVTQDDEIGRLSRTFNEMMEGIAEREEKIAYQARHDMVTGLPNRLAFEAHLAQAIGAAPAMRLSIAFLQIGRFAEINNTLGHDTGDQLMRALSQSVKNITPPQTFLARHASNMFALCLPTPGDAAESDWIERLLSIFTGQVDLAGSKIDIMATIGLARYPDHGVTPRMLLQRADSAVYVAKQKNAPYAVYDADLDPHKPERLSMMGELRQGLEKGQFRLYYQPKIDIATGRITAAEALIRWVHPERGFMPPDQFIPLAEQTGNIAHVTAWALETAIAQVRDWESKKITARIAVNLSARDLINRHLPDMIRERLAFHHVGADRLILEITESAIMEDPVHALSVLTALNGMGLTLSIDDYGTGYSSLAYLKSLPVQEIKIDKSFVLHLAGSANDQILVRSTIELGHNLGLKVTAEGIEDAASLAILAEHGCETGQGYHISKPLPAPEFEAFYLTSRWSPLRDESMPALTSAAAGTG